MSFVGADLFLLAGFLGGLMQFHINARRRMMQLRVFNCLMFVLYFALIGKEVAAAACGIAMLGSLLQAVFKDDVLEKTRIVRTGLAILLAAAGGYIYAGSAGDMLPLVAVAGARLIECFSRPQHLRIGFLGTQFCWLTYHWQQGLVLPFFTETIFILSNLSAIWLYEQERKKRRLVPAAVKAA